MLRIISLLIVVFALPLSCYAFPITPRVLDTTALPWKPLPKFMVPEGTKNVALKKRVTSSDNFPIIGELLMVTDGSKELQREGWVKNEAGQYKPQQQENWVELGPGTQWVQIDLGQRSRIYGIHIWHYFAGPGSRVYRDVIVQVCDENTFTKDMRTIYNNDQDETSKLGKGKDREFYEHNHGFRMDTRGKNYEGIRARFVRLYSRGNTDDAQNHYIEVEVIGQEGLLKEKRTTPPRLREWRTKIPPPPYW